MTTVGRVVHASSALLPQATLCFTCSLPFGLSHLAPRAIRIWPLWPFALGPCGLAHLAPVAFRTWPLWLFTLGLVAFRTWPCGLSHLALWPFALRLVQRRAACSPTSKLYEANHCLQGAGSSSSSRYADAKQCGRTESTVDQRPVVFDDNCFQNSCISRSVSRKPHLSETVAQPLRWSFVCCCGVGQAVRAPLLLFTRGGAQYLFAACGSWRPHAGGTSG